MREPSLSEAAFPVALCPACEKTVLTYVGLAADDGERRRCVHCDGAVDGEIEWVSPGELEARGYYFGAPPAKSCGCSGGGCSARPARGN